MAANHKILLLGDPDAGKSCLLLRYVDGTFSERFISTIGVDYKSKETEVNGESVKLQIWDPVGEARFGHITSSFYRGAAGVFLVFDIGNEESFSNISHWYSAVQRFSSSNVCTILIGTKCDKENRVISKEKAQEFADSEGLFYIETSAKEDINIKECFNYIAEGIQDAKTKENSQPSVVQQYKKKSKLSACSIQ